MPNKIPEMLAFARLSHIRMFNPRLYSFGLFHCQTSHYSKGCSDRLSRITSSQCHIRTQEATNKEPGHQVVPARQFLLLMCSVYGRRLKAGVAYHPYLVR